jgi:hypothetical protein
MGCGHAASSFSLLSVPPTNRSATTAPQTANTPSIRNAIWMPSEHQPPADRISEHASEQRPERIAESGRTQTAGESCPALRAETEPHAQDGRPHHRAANAHDEAGGEQQPNVRRETTDHRERGEDAGTDEKDASAAEHIGEPAHCEVLTLVPKVSSMAGRATESAVKSLGSRTRRPPWRSCRGSPIYRGARPYPPSGPRRVLNWDHCRIAISAMLPGANSVASLRGGATTNRISLPRSRRPR